ncbi:maleylpyruvate isomerase family mycothiol-dependent enzyme [Streptomyces sp. FB2]|uniref:maleylpyruvate isomerase family mycothiol-dependent enzyme n=1 Tax=Streptomyces sp. FB2 TaxID=2902454 RepID=UPI0027E5148A|nr:maleylpyruvate isomerase family mycothiol-dependent enzyme [Streptomyces sp. FB2]
MLRAHLDTQISNEALKNGTLPQIMQSMTERLKPEAAYLRAQRGRTTGVARHRVQETTVHTYDVQVALGAPRPLPDDVALDGVDEFLATCCATTAAWPHKPTTFYFHATEGYSWRLTVDGDGARSTRLFGEGTDAAGVSVTGTAGELVLYLYDRIPVESLELAGDPGLLGLLRAWEPEE